MGLGGLGNLGSARGSIELDVRDAIAGVRQVSAALRELDAQKLGGASAGAQQLTGDLQRLDRQPIATRANADLKTLGQGLLGVSVAIAGGFGLGLNAARDFEAGVSAIGAVTGATGHQLDALRAKAIQLGKDTSFSASEAASAIEELAKAGVSVEDILGGAADGATALAAAAGIGLPQAAILVSNALNIFGLAGDQATHVADVFAAASNKSAADAEGLGQGLAAVGTVADQFGLSLEDTVGALALFADHGLKGSDAGTSLKTALTSMLTPAGEGADKIAELGLNFRDANGEFIGLAGAADELRAKLGPLSKAEQDAALRAIFGSDAIRVGAILYGEGGDAVDEYTAAVDDAGAANDNAKKRLDNLNGSWEAFKGSLETVAIVFLTRFLPVLREFVDAGTAVLGVLIDLPDGLQTVIGVATAAVGAFAGIAGGVILLLPKLRELRAGFAALRAGMLAFAAANPALLALVAAVAVFGLLYKTNFGGLADLTDRVVGTIVDKVGRFADAFSTAYGAIQRFGTLGNAGAVFSALGQAIDDVFGLDVVGVFNAMGRAADNVGEGVGRIARQFSRLSKIIKRDGLAEGLDQLFTGDVGAKMLSGLGDIASALPRVLGEALAGITTGFGPLDSILANTGAGLKRLGSAIEAVLDGDFPKALEAGKAAFSRFATAFSTAGGAIFDGLADAFAAIPWAALWDLAKAGLVVAAGGLLELGSLALDAALGFAGDLLSLSVDAVGWIVGKIPALVDAALPLGSALLDVVVSLAGDLLSLATNAVAWIGDKVGLLEGLSLDKIGMMLDGDVGLAGDLYDLRGNAGGWIRAEIGSLAGQVITATGVALDAAVSLAGDLLDLATSGIGWVSGKLPALGSLALTAGASTVSALVTLAGVIGDVATQGVGWVAAQIPAIGALALSTADSTLSALVTLAGDLGDLAPDAWAWVVGKVENTLSHTLTLGVLALTAASVNLANLVTSEQFASAASTIGGGIVSAITNLGTLASDIGGAVIGKIKDVDWPTLVTADSFDLGASFGTALRSAIGTAAEVLTGMAGGIGDALAAIGPYLAAVDWATAATTVATAIGVGMLAAPAAIAALGVALASFIGGAVTGLVFGEGDGDWAGLASSIGGKIVEALGALTSLGHDILVAIATVISPGAGDFVAEGLAIAGTLVTEISAGFAGKGFDILLAIASAISAVAGNAGNFVSEGAAIASALATAIGQWLKDNFNPLDWIDVDNPFTNSNDGGNGPKGVTYGNRGGGADTGAGGSSAAQLNTYQGPREAPAPVVFPAPNLTAYAAGLAAAVTMVVVATSVIAATAATIVGPMGAAGERGSASLAAGLVVGFATAVRVAFAGAGAVEGAATPGSLYGEGSGVGASLGDGIVAGIGAKVGAVAEAAAAIVRAAINSAKSTADINSPSGETERQVGEPLGEGVGVGLLNKLGLARDAMRQLVGEVLGVGSGGALAQSLRSSLAGAGGGTTVINHHAYYAVSPDDLAALVRDSRRGAGAADWVDDIPRAFYATVG